MLREDTMCDYSLETYRSKPALKGEKYEVTKFNSGSKGLASPGNCSTAVCVPYDTRLRLEHIPEDLQKRFGVGPVEEVTFVQVDHGPYRDGIVFANGTTTSLQHLSLGITAIVTDALDRPVDEVSRFKPVVARQPAARRRSLVQAAMEAMARQTAQMRLR